MGIIFVETMLLFFGNGSIPNGKTPEILRRFADSQNQILFFNDFFGNSSFV